MANSLVLFIITFSILGSFGKANDIILSSNYSSFYACLIRNGLDASIVVGRSNSTEYEYLNYQWQLKPPTILPLAYILVREESHGRVAVRCGRASGVRLVAKSGGHSFEK